MPKLGFEKGGDFLRQLVRLLSVIALLLSVIAFQNCNERLPKSALRDTTAGQLSPSSVTPTADTTAPVLTLNKAPAAEIAANSATFEFSADDLTAQFECSLNMGGFETCLSPKTYSSLADGNYRLELRARDSAGNFSPSKIYSWKVNKAALAVTISSSVAPYTRSQSSTFAFSSQSTSATFECKVDSLDYLPCVSPKLITGLPEGNHTFQVRAKSSDGIYSAPAPALWTVDLTAPLIAINSGPAGNVNIGQAGSAVATFTFNIQDVGGSQFESATCQLGAGAATACTNSASYTVSGDSVTYTFTVTAKDKAGNTSSASRAFMFYTEQPPTNPESPGGAE